MFGHVLYKNVSTESVYDQQILDPLPAEHVEADALEWHQVCDGGRWIYVWIGFGPLIELFASVTRLCHLLDLLLEPSPIVSGFCSCICFHYTLV